jgi:tetratricopeptide (TPR) repeat protein
MNSTGRRAKGPSEPDIQAIVGLYDRARRAQEAGDLVAAVKLYERVLTLWPTHAAARDRLGFDYLRQGRPDQAAEQYAELVRTVPQVLLQFDKVLATIKTLVPQFGAMLERPSRKLRSHRPRSAPLPPIHISALFWKRHRSSISASSAG